MEQEEKKLPAELEEAAKEYTDKHPYATIMGAFIAGAEWDRAKMMEGAVDGRYMKADGKVYVESWPLDIEPDSVKAGDEVSLIVIPKEK